MPCTTHPSGGAGQGGGGCTGWQVGGEPVGWVCGLQPPVHLSWVTCELPAPSPHCLVTPPHLAHCCTSRRCLTLAAGTTGSWYHSAMCSLVSVLPRVALSRDLSPGSLVQRRALPLVGERPSPREGSGPGGRHLPPGLRSPGFQAGGGCWPRPRSRTPCPTSSPPRSRVCSSLCGVSF